MISLLLNLILSMIPPLIFNSGLLIPLILLSFNLSDSLSPMSFVMYGKSKLSTSALSEKGNR